MGKLNRGRILFIGQDYNIVSEGLSKVTERNYRLLTMLGYDIDSILLPPTTMWTKVRSILTMRSYGFNRNIEAQIKTALNRQYEFVFFDRSIFGDAVKRFALRGYKTVCFFHNVETQLSKARLRVTKNPLYLLLYHNIKYNEDLSVKYSNKIIAISDRDQNELQRTYKLKSVFLMPTSFLPINTEDLKARDCVSDKYCLFVGSDFFANYEGISWFINEVADKVNAEVWIVGSVCNSLANLQIPSNVKLLGYADDLTEIYKNASCVISPIFSGSGLKTKTIEAIRYGKFILGTEEAFVGINKSCIDEIGKLCKTPKDFIEGINGCLKEHQVFNQGSIDVFNSYFSDEVAFFTLKRILE